MYKMKMLGLVILIFGSVFPPLTYTQAQSDTYATPQAMLQAYYNAINLHDFETAYNMYMGVSQTPAEFAEGYSNTQFVTPYFGVFDMDTTPISGRVQSVLVAQEFDSSAGGGHSFSTYAGCFWVERTTASGTWKISSSDFAVVLDHNTRPTSVTITELLNHYCTDNLNTVTLSARAYPLQDLMLHNYFAKINNGDYVNAYATWLEPLPDPQPNGAPAEDYRPAFDQFVTGYADTRFINLYTGRYDEVGASAGKSYLNGLMPVVLIGQNNDNQFEVFAGCYVIGVKQDGSYGIVNGQLFSMDNNVPLGYDILEYLNTSCVELVIPN